MSFLKSLSRSKKSSTAKISTSFKIALACMVLATVGVVVKMTNDFAWIVTEVQHTIAPTSNMPSQAEGAFYFIEPLTTTL